MTPERVLKALRRKLGGRAQSTQLDNHLLDCLNEAQENLESTAPFPYFIESYQTGIVPSTVFNGFAAPSDYIIEHEERPVSWTSADGLIVVQLEKRFFEELSLKKSGDGTPKYYCVVGGDKFYLFPSSTTGSYSIRYYARSNFITSDDLTIETPWYRFAPFLLMAKAGLDYAGNTLKDPDLVALFQQQVMQAESQLLVLNTQQSMAKHDLSAQFLRED